MPPKNTEVEEAAVVAERTKKMESVWSYILREIINFLISNIIMLLILAVVVCWQTKLFGYYAVEAVNDRKRSAAMEKLPFGKVEVKITKPNEEGNRIVGGDYVTAIVTGYDEKGMQFYSSRNRQQATGPLVIAVTSGESIMGLEDGLLHMRVGETATVRVPPDMAFGTRGKRAWNIEPWAVLTLEITAIAASREKPAESNDIEIPVAQREKKVQEAQIDEPTSTTDTHELSSFLEKAGLGKFTKKLEHIGLTTIEDFSLLESADDLPEDLPTFAKKKLLSIARKLKLENTKKEDNTKQEEETTTESKQTGEQQKEQVKDNAESQNSKKPQDKTESEPDTCLAEGTC